MRPERALQIVQAMGKPRPRRMPRFASRPSYVRVTPAWTWNNATPRERGNAVRSTSQDIPQMTAENLQNLFNLTWPGLVEILRGSDWKPEYEQAET